MFLVGPRTLESDGGMALLALWAEPPGVDIVLGMATGADHGGLDHVLWLDVALGATGFGVRAGERKAGPCRMIENPELPAIRVVTSRAIGAQRALVDILLGVTALAALRSLVETLVRVTLAARDRHVQTKKRIGRQVMVEGHLTPAGDGVTRIASLPERAPVRIGGSVATGAVLTELLRLHGTGVAHVAREFGVGTLERKILLVIVGRDPPDFSGVAVTAHRTEAASMTIVRLVTAGAGARNGVVDIAAAMTVGATDMGVATEEREAGFTAMFELLRAPVRRGVTCAAIVALAALVDIIGHVTADALFG